MRGSQVENDGSGLAPVTEGWFVVNVRDAEWWSSETRGARCSFESEYGDPPIEFAQLGINVTVLEPGQTLLYHAETDQEAFLVVSGECALLVEGEDASLAAGVSGLQDGHVDPERRLGPWDFFHAPAWTEHGFVGAGEGPCVIVMVGSRSGPGVRYPVSELAARYGASVVEETSDWRQANGALERFGRERLSNWARPPRAQAPLELRRRQGRPSTDRSGFEKPSRPGSRSVPPMKTMTCKQLGGPCQVEHHGKDHNEVIKARDRHLRTQVAAGDETHREAHEAMRGGWKRPVSGLGWYRDVKREFAALP